jgi:hypothetical protein
MFQDMLDQLIAYVKAFLEQVKEYIQDHPEEAQTAILNALYSFDSWLHNFIDEVKAFVPGAPTEPTTQPAQKKK